MARPSKSTSVLVGEGKSHRTKAEIAQRKEAECALSSGETLKERPQTKENPVAHKEFLRVNRLLKAVGKNDALHERIINQYCLLQAECVELQQLKWAFSQSRLELQQEYQEGCEMKSSMYYKLLTTMQNNILALDKQGQVKQKMMLDIEKECAMTIASAMRSIPKAPTTGKNPLMEALGL